MSQPVTHSLVGTLRGVPDFAVLDDAALLEVVGASANLHWSEGSTVFSTGSPAEAVYVVLTGRVRILDPDGDGQEAEQVAEIGPGDYFGEHSLLLYTTHSKSAVTVEDSELMVIPKDSFQPLLGDNPELAAHFRAKLEHRLLDRGDYPRT